MSVQTLLLDFSLEPNRLGDECGQKSVFSKIESILKEYIPNLILVTDIKIDGGSLKLLTGKRGSSISIRLFDRGLITINIEYYKEENEDPLIDFESFRDAETRLHKYIDAEKAQAYPPIKRTLFSRYFPSSDERLLEYDIDEVVFDKRSPFQKVQIVHSKSLGNMLVLDELQNISEADLIYTETLMQRGKECYQGAEIVILGGGDGGLLFELMKEKPKFVWMLEIDEMVLSACNKHMKSVCGDVLEERKASNYEIIVDDCMVTLNKFISEGKKFDYVFGDLTDIPISDTPSGQIWDFIMTILEASFNILKPTGKFMTHGNGANSPESLKMYEAQLAKLSNPVTYTKTSAFVPSFLEDWIFYQISFRHSGDGDQHVD